VKYENEVLDHTQPGHMLSNLLLLRIGLFLFFVLIGYALVSTLAAGSTIGFVLAVISLCSTILFIYLLHRADATATRHPQE